MQFIWPIKADYRIVYVSPDYQRTIIGRQKRDNVWIMARTPQISAAELQDLRQRVAQQSYDVSKLQLVPQQWPESAGSPSRSAEEPCE
jgi:apolipoprotein D and lipocalin family protein